VAEKTLGTRLSENLARVRQRIESAAQEAGRSAAGVRLVAVTKRRPTVECDALLQLGQLDLGESFPQNLWERAGAVAGPARWHLIGHLQSNKAAKTLPILSMIHAVDSLKLLKYLDQLASTLQSPPAACLQVNCSGESSKHGWAPSAILADADAIATCRHLPIVGLMTMAALGPSSDHARPAFSLLRETRDRLAQATGLPLLDLSMGMSHDYEAAIAEGATWVRIGSALFEGITT
jgi:hypothetical protein